MSKRKRSSNFGWNPFWIRQCFCLPVLFWTAIGLEQDIPNPRNSPFILEAFMCCVYFGQMPDDQPLNTYTPPLPSSSSGAPTTISTNRYISWKYTWGCSLSSYVIICYCYLMNKQFLFQLNTKFKMKKKCLTVLKIVSIYWKQLF